jgi:WhiB family redox-sensing transcriptional regulator
MSDWRDQALCRGFPQRWWFPEQGGRYETAVWVCSMCPSREPCLQFALDERIIHGVWGGLTEAGRRSHRRKMAGRSRPVTGKQPRPADECQVI